MYQRRHDYPEVSQLQAELYEGIRADAKLLDLSFPKVSEGEDVTVHVICQCLGYNQRAALLRLNLGNTQMGNTERREHRMLTKPVHFFPQTKSVQVFVKKIHQV